MRSMVSAIVLTALLLAGAAHASEWAQWRGPTNNGVSDEKGLVSSWSVSGENLVWRADFVGRSTPVVFDGRVCAVGRTGSGITKQEVTACWDAGDGKLLWEHRFNVYHTAVPFTRVGWANVAGDPETGNLYVHGVGGLFFCFDRGGKVVWSRSLTEEFGRISGYGGRTHSPMIDEERVVLGFSNSGWGDQVQPRHRYFAFDKRTGELRWISTPGGRPETVTTQATPVAAVINGMRLLIGGNGDGWVYAMKAHTGEKVWGFHLSKQGINTSVVVDGDRVYATSGDENIDEGTKGRIVCIDGTGSGDVTRTHERWRVDEVEVGFASPLLHEGRLYVVDDSANMFAIDAASGKSIWQFNLGTVGKASPVWADGKIYATEVNGHFHILKPEDSRAVSLDRDQILVGGQRYAEIYGSPAVAYGRVYFTTEEGLYCLGDRSAPFRPSAHGGPVARTGEAESPATTGPAAATLVTPAEVSLMVGGTAAFTTTRYDAQGRSLGAATGTWAVEGIAGSIDGAGKLTTAAAPRPQVGLVTLRDGDRRATARVRVFPELPWREDFETFQPDQSPSAWVGGAGRFVARKVGDGTVLVKPFMDQGIERSSLFIGPTHPRVMSGYTIQADLMGSIKGRRRPDMGLIAGGYTLDLMGGHQRLQIRDWVEPRLEKTIDFAWDPDVWYTMKLQAEVHKDKAIVRGKVWPASAQEPASWTISVEDPVPIREGSPGLYGYSAADIFYDNIMVTGSGR